jgi:hypothetical protein
MKREVSRDNNFNKDQIRGLELIFIAIKKKYPFIKGLKLADDYEKYSTSLYVDLYVNMFEIAEYLNFGVDEYYVKNKQLMVSSAISPFMVSDTESDKEIFNKSYDLRERITNNLNFIYGKLPDNYHIHWKVDNVEILVQISIDKFIHVETP